MFDNMQNIILHGTCMAAAINYTPAAMHAWCLILLCLFKFLDALGL
jgi:hypothetical protein